MALDTVAAGTVLQKAKGPFFASALIPETGTLTIGTVTLCSGKPGPALTLADLRKSPTP